MEGLILYGFLALVGVTFLVAYKRKRLQEDMGLDEETRVKYSFIHGWWWLAIVALMFSPAGWAILILIMLTYVSFWFLEWMPEHKELARREAERRRKAAEDAALAAEEEHNRRLARAIAEETSRSRGE